MNKIKKALRLLGLVALILLAVTGVGITGVYLPGNKERYMDKEIRIERVDKREDEEEANKENE